MDIFIIVAAAIITVSSLIGAVIAIVHAVRS